jgi:hypothetical protein
MDQESRNDGGDSNLPQSVVMPSEQSVTYIDFGLNSVAAFWDRLIVPGVRTFVQEPSARSAFDASLSLWHLHDWVWRERHPDEGNDGPRLNAYRTWLATACPELGWLRDVADAGKHRGFGRNHIVGGAEPHSVSGPAQTLIGVSVGGRVAYFLVMNDGSHHDLAVVLQVAVEFWRIELADKNLPSPFI